MPWAVDLHVHTRRYSPCAEFVREHEIAGYGTRAGLHGIVLTEHDELWRRREIRELQRHAADIRIYRGVECTTPRAHLLVIGLSRLGGLHRGSSFDEVIRRARGDGAAVILAHPYREGDPEGLPIDQVDAIEVGSTSFSADEAERSRRLAERFGKPTVASSDAHALSRIGWAWTELPALPGTERELAALIRSGAGRPVIPRPFPS